MTGETRKRMEAYQQLLPGMKEKVIAAAVALLIALTVTATATYAWITLSQAPEVADIATTMAANGNLEIALSDDDGLEPDEFDIDEGTTITKKGSVNSANLQWGNLINLGDTSYYGIDNLALRPAQINEGSLLNNPLYGAVYGADGRITRLDTQYTFAKWDGKQFLASNAYGVRAIAAYTVATSDTSAAEYNEKYAAVMQAYSKAGDYYNKEFKNTIGGLGTVMSTYLQSKINGTELKGQNIGNGQGENLPLSTQDVLDVLTTYEAFFHTMELQLNAMVQMANFQQYIYAKANNVDWTPVTGDELINHAGNYVTGHLGDKKATTPAEAIQITGLHASSGDCFANDYRLAKEDLSTLRALYEKSSTGAQVYSKELNTPINRLCAPTKAKIDDQTVDQWVAKAKKLDTSILSLRTGDHKAQFCEGLLKRFEQYAIPSSKRLSQSSDKNETSNAAGIKATANLPLFGPISIDMTGHICTDASGLSTFDGDCQKINASDFSAQDKVATDTYGMAMDFWVRTNAEETYLTLEGAVAKGANGEILSYDGVNRIWGSTGNVNLTTDSTTQGGGSCYVYYADSPADVARSLDLLKSMKVAFVSSSGELLATAGMDTVNYYAQNGRITVPLVLEGSTTQYTYEDEKQVEVEAFAIQRLTMDDPSRITVILYLDGSTLDNTKVLSAAEIQGQLNIQFGSSVKLETSGDSKLLTDVRKVTAEIDHSNFNYATDRKNMVSVVTLKIDGAVPENVTAFFVREINATQGSREKVFYFAPEEGTNKFQWEGQYQFNAPGVYHLRHVQLDGVDYALTTPLEVRISGFAITDVTWEHGNNHTVYTADSTHVEKIRITINTDSETLQPSTVKAMFTRSDGVEVQVNTSKNVTNGGWEGTANFVASGNYTLSYVEIDGKTYAVGTNLEKKLELHLGLKAAVYNDGSVENENFDAEKLQNNAEIYYKKVRFIITDDANTRLENMEDVWISYASGGASTAHKVKAEWNESGYYTAVIPINKAGRYSFAGLQLGGDVITRVTEAPVFTIISPDPPIYDTSSKSTYHDDVLYIPNSTDAILGPIKIRNSASANIRAVLYNDEAKAYYTVEMAEGGNGRIYYDGDAWKIKLPTYTATGSNTPQIDGNWSVVSLQLWDCYKNDKYYSNSDPMVWLGTSDEAEAYAAAEKLTAQETLDFDQLSIEVSAQVNVVMTPGKTALGDSKTAFMTAHKVGDIGMSVAITDGKGRSIPAEAFKSGVELNLTYQDNTDTKYGYAVNGYAASVSGNGQWTITMEKKGDVWTPNSACAALVWQYVGVYRVDNLTVNGTAYTPGAAGAEGVPTMYTVTSAGPDASNIGQPKVTQGSTELGITSNGTIVGAFLAEHDPQIKVQTGLVDGKGNEVKYVALDGATATLQLHYTGGSDTNGGYTFSGSNALTDIAMSLTANGTTYSSVGTKLLAGTYELRGTLTWNGVTKPLTGLKDLHVFSVRPDVTVTAISPAAGTQVTSNANITKADNHLTANAEAFTGIPSMGTHYAIVYMEYKIGDEPGVCDEEGAAPSYAYSSKYAYYSAPTVTLSVGNAGEASVRMQLKENTIELTDDANTITVGEVRNSSGKHTEKYGRDFWGDLNGVFVYRADTATIVGSNTITQVTSQVDGVTYTRTLESPLFISQPDHGSPTLTLGAGTGVSLTVKSDGDVALGSGAAVAGGTRLTVTVQAQEGYYAPTAAAPEGAMEWTQVSADETEAVYTCRMAAEDMTIAAEAKAYPTLRYGAATGIQLTVSAGEKTLASGARVAPGTEITVQLATSPEAGLYRPTMAGVGTAVTSGDYGAAYTFTMGDSDRTLAAPTAQQMAQLQWQNTSALTFTATDDDESRSVPAGGYVIPNHRVTVTVTADGGYDPALTQPENARPNGDTSSTTRKQYSFTMPNSTVTLAGTAKSYPVLRFGSDKAAVTKLLSGNVTVATENATEKGILPGNTVEITIAAKNGYYAPQMTKPTGVTNWSVVSEDDRTATYRFTMPSAEVDAGSNMTAQAAPTVTVNNSHTTITLSGRNADGSDLTGSRVQPGTTVTVTAAVSTGWFNPTVSASGATLSERSGDYDTATYTFTMGTANVTLNGSATQDPTVKVNGNDKLTATVNGGASGVRIHPGTKNVRVEVSAGADYYDPMLSVADGGVTLSERAQLVRYVRYAYTFDMGTENVVLTGDATLNPEIKTTGTDKAAITTDQSSSRVRPGTLVTVTADMTGNYYAPRVTVTSGGVTVKTIGENDRQATYSFVMGNQNVTLVATASEKPCVKFDISGCGKVTVNGINTSNGSQYYFMPGDNVTIYAENSSKNLRLFGSMHPCPTLECSSNNEKPQTVKSGGTEWGSKSYCNWSLKITVQTGTISISIKGE